MELCPFAFAAGLGASREHGGLGIRSPTTAAAKCSLLTYVLPNLDDIAQGCGRRLDCCDRTLKKTTNGGKALRHVATTLYYTNQEELTIFKRDVNKVGKHVNFVPQG